MFKVTTLLPKYTGYRFLSKVAEKCEAVESFRIEHDVNGMTVVSLQPKYRTISRVAAVFSAGSRFEEYESLGMNHFLRRCVGLASGGFSAVNVTRHFQQMGTSVRCIGTRETLSYVADMSEDMTDKVLELLSHVTTRQTFYHWELTESVKPMMRLDIQYLLRRDFDTLNSELLHKAAFRDTLGNSLFGNELYLGKWNIDVIEKFVDKHFSATRCMLVGIGVNHDNLAKHAMNFRIRPRPDLKVLPTVFRGGEIRKEIPLDYAIASVVWEAPGFGKINESIAASILAETIDNGINLSIKGNNGELELIKRAVHDPKINQNCSANTTYTAYSDTGMFGFTAVGAPFTFQDALCGLYRHVVTMGKNGVPVEDFNTAKKAFIVKLWMGAQCLDSVTESLIAQCSTSDNILSIEKIIEIANSITIDDVNKVAKTILSNPNKAMSCVGDLSNMPFVSDLQC